MASNDFFTRQDARLYELCIRFLKITGIRLPLQPVPASPTGSLGKIEKYYLKVTLLHGTEQQKIGQFEVIDQECIINHQLTCHMSRGRQDVLEKLHVYIDQTWSSGLSGHITVDLKEFFEDSDAEVYLEYPLFAVGTPHASKTATLEMTVLCTLPSKAVNHTEHADQNHGSILSVDQSEMEPLTDHNWSPPIIPEYDSSSRQLDTASEQIGESEDVCIDKINREVHLLKEMEGDLIELNAKLHRLVAGHSWNRGAAGSYRNEDQDEVIRPEVLAAMFFAAGMSFQQQVDRMHRLMMSKGTQHLRSTSSTLLLESTTSLPALSNMVSQYPGVQEVVTFLKEGQMRGESSSDSCGPPLPSSSSSEAATNYRGLRDLDDNEISGGYADYHICPKCCYGGPADGNPSTSCSLSYKCPALDKASCSSHSLIPDSERSIIPRKNNSSSTHNLRNLIGSILGTIAILGLGFLGARDTLPRGKRERPVAAAGSMVARQQVASIQAVLKSNPGKFR